MVTGDDYKLMEAANMPTDESSQCGGVKTAIEVTGAVIGEVFPAWPAEVFGGDDIPRYMKVFYINKNGSDTAENVGIWLPGALDDTASAGVIKAVSTSASDGSTKKLYIIGLVSAVWDSENLILNGTDEVVGAKTFDLGSPLRIEVRLVSSGVKTAAAGNITIKQNDVEIGMIPATFYHATHEFKIGLVDTLNDSGTNTNTLTAPDGIVFTKPNSEGESLAAADDMVPDDGQGIWVEWIQYAGILPLADIYCPIFASGDSV